MISIEISKLEAMLMINTLTSYEMKLRYEKLRLTGGMDIRDWKGRKRLMYLTREISRVSEAIYDMMIEYEDEWSDELP